jgi:hypothetical protein
MSTLLKNTLILGALMNITNETMRVIEQSLFDTYGIKSKISFFFKTHEATFYKLAGSLNERSFVGTLDVLKSNIVENKFTFSVSGHFDDDDNSLKNHILSDNVLLIAINEVNQLVHDNFARVMPLFYKSFYLGVGSFFFINEAIEQLTLDMTPEFYLNLEFGRKDDDTMMVSKSLMFTSYATTKKGLKEIQYQLPDCLTLRKINDHSGVDEFKKTLLREYMSSYSRTTSNELVLALSDFDTLSYESIVDHLKIQSMQDIT